MDVELDTIWTLTQTITQKLFKQMKIIKTYYNLFIWNKTFEPKTEKLGQGNRSQRNKQTQNSILMLCRYSRQHLCEGWQCSLHKSMILAVAAGRFPGDCDHFRGEVFMGIIILDSICWIRGTAGRTQSQLETMHVCNPMIFV